jgi:tetratricopeptide (TPR) repeat protein
MIPYLWAILGNLAYWQGEPEKAKTYAVQAVNILKDVENDLLASVFMSYEELGHLSWQMGEYCLAEKYYQSVINISKNQHLYIESETLRCCIAMSQGDYHKARVLLNNIYLSIRGRNFGRFNAFVTQILAELEWGTGNYAEADKWLTELQELTVTDYIRSEDQRRMIISLERAKVAISKKNWHVATEHTKSALKTQIQSPLPSIVFVDLYSAVYLSAIITFAQGWAIKAARLLGTSEKSYRLHGLTFPLFRRQMIDQTIDDTRNALEEGIFTTAWEAGKAMDLNQALVYALEVMEAIQQTNR